MPSTNKNSGHTIVVIFGTTLALLTLNYVIRQWTGYPFVYCGMKWLITPLITPLSPFVLITLTAYFFYVMLSNRGFATAASVAVLMIVWGAMPDVLKTLGELGVACHQEALKPR